MRVCFHGTNKESAQRIRSDGFAVGTYFAKHLEDAIAFGGDYVFWVRFNNDGFEGWPGDWWQFRASETIPPERIWQMWKMNAEKVFENPTPGQPHV